MHALDSLLRAYLSPRTRVTCVSRRNRRGENEGFCGVIDWCNVENTRTHTCTAQKVAKEEGRSRCNVTQPPRTHCVTCVHGKKIINNPIVEPSKANYLRTRGVLRLLSRRSFSRSPRAPSRHRAWKNTPEFEL